MKKNKIFEPFEAGEFKTSSLLELNMQICFSSTRTGEILLSPKPAFNLKLGRSSASAKNQFKNWLELCYRMFEKHPDLHISLSCFPEFTFDHVDEKSGQFVHFIPEELPF